MAHSGVLQGREVILRRRDGSTVTCLQNSALIRDTGGRVSRQQGTFVDITERRSMEQRLHRQQEFARRLMDCFPDLVVRLLRIGTAAAPSSVRALGNCWDTRRRNWWVIAWPSTWMPAIAWTSWPGSEGIRSSDGAESGVIDVQVERRNGEMRLFRTTASPLLSESGEVEGMIVSMSD